MSSETLYHVALVRTDVSENISPHLQVPQADTIPQLFYFGITFDQPLHRGTLCRVEENSFLGDLMGEQ
jgi:hypothetical protein